MVKVRRELIMERYDFQLKSKKWKRILDISQDATVICNEATVLYHNLALTDLLQKVRGDETMPLAEKVDSLFSGTDVIDSDGAGIGWNGNIAAYAAVS